MESNIVYWRPPGNFPAVLNRADIRGAQRIFRDNRIYSNSPWVVESNKELSFRDNRYTTCGTNEATWVFDSHFYRSFDEFRAGAQQDQGSTWKFDQGAAPCLGGERLQAEVGPSGARANKNAASADDKTSTGWTVVSEIPADIDAQGLLDAAAAGQFMVLKNLYLQYRASGLRVEVTLDLKHAGAGESAQNMIRDLGMSGIKASELDGQELLTRPKTRLVAPDGSTAREWQDFFGPADIGLAVRSTLGEPLYSQMESEDGSIQR